MAMFLQDCQGHWVSASSPCGKAAIVMILVGGILNAKSKNPGTEALAPYKGSWLQLKNISKRRAHTSPSKVPSYAKHLELRVGFLSIE